MLTLRESISDHCRTALAAAYDQFGINVPEAVWSGLQMNIARMIVGPALRSLVANNAGAYALADLSRVASTSVRDQVQQRIAHARLTWNTMPRTLDAPLEATLNAFWEPVDNIFCKTGQGGGVDPTCTKDAPDTGGGSGGASFEDSKFDLSARTIRGAKKIKFSDAATGPDNVWLGKADQQSLTVTTTGGTKFVVSALSESNLLNDETSRGVSFDVKPHGQFGATRISKADFAELFDKVAPAILAYIDHYKPEVVGLAGRTTAKTDLFERLAKTLVTARPKYFAAVESVPGAAGYPGINYYMLGHADEKATLIRSFRSVTGMRPGNWPQFQVLNMQPSPEVVEWDGVGNIYCPNGPGGGKDPSCTKEDAGGSTGGALKKKIREKMSEVTFGAGSPAMLTPDTASDDTETVMQTLSPQERDAIRDEVNAAVEKRVDELMKEFSPRLKEDDLMEMAGLNTEGITNHIESAFWYNADLNLSEAEYTQVKNSLLKALGGTEGLDGMRRIAKQVDAEFPKFKEIWDNEITAAKRHYDDAKKAHIDYQVGERRRELKWDLRESLLTERAWDLYEKEPSRFGGQLFRDEAPRNTWFHYEEPALSWQPNSSGRDSLRFETPSGRLFTVTAYTKDRQVTPQDHSTTTQATIVFKDGTGSFAATGRGEAHEVFSHVVPAVAKYVEEKHPGIIEFSAHGESRIGLYDKLVKTVASLSPDYMAVYYDSGEEDRSYFVVPRKDKERLSTIGHKEPDGVLVNSALLVTVVPEINPLWFTPYGWDLTTNDECGAGSEGAPGFQHGNPCATGGSAEPHPAGGLETGNKPPQVKRTLQKYLVESNSIEFSREETSNLDEGGILDVRRIPLIDIEKKLKEYEDYDEVQKQIDTALERAKEDMKRDYDPEDDLDEEDVYTEAHQMLDDVQAEWEDILDDNRPDLSDEDLTMLEEKEVPYGSSAGLSSILSEIPSDEKFAGIRNDLRVRIQEMDDEFQKTKEKMLDRMQDEHATNFEEQATEKLEEKRDELQERAYRRWAEANDELFRSTEGTILDDQYLSDTWYKHAGGYGNMLKIETPSGKQFVLTAMDRGETLGLTSHHIIMEDQTGSTERTDSVGGRDALALFNKILPAMIAYTREKEPDVVTFSAAEDGTQVKKPELGIDRDGKSRQHLYERLVRTAASVLPGYSAAYEETPFGRTYVIVKDEHKAKIAAKSDSYTVLVNKEDTVHWFSKDVEGSWFTPTGWEGEYEVSFRRPEEHVTADTPTLETRNAKRLMDTGEWTPPTILNMQQTERDREFVDRVNAGQVRNALLLEAHPDGTETLIANVVDSHVQVHDREAYDRFFRRIYQ